MVRQFRIILSALIALALFFLTMAFICFMAGCSWTAELAKSDYKDVMPTARVGLSGSF